MANCTYIVFGWRTREFDSYWLHLLLHEEQEEEKDIRVWNQQKEHKILHGKNLFLLLYLFDENSVVVKHSNVLSVIID